MNSVGRSTAVVSRLTTSMECKDMSMLTSADRYSVTCELRIRRSRHSMATMGLLSTSSGSLCGERPDWKSSFASPLSSVSSRCWSSALSADLNARAMSVRISGTAEASPASRGSHMSPGPSSGLSHNTSSGTGGSSGGSGRYSIGSKPCNVSRGCEVPPCPESSPPIARSSSTVGVVAGGCTPGPGPAADATPTSAPPAVSASASRTAIRGRTPAPRSTGTRGARSAYSLRSASRSGTSRTRSGAPNASSSCSALILAASRSEGGEQTRWMRNCRSAPSVPRSNESRKQAMNGLKPPASR
mmetsp:Transcript_6327/g.20138  ORF Transcript_6327/g.20138 Transcript_6327/m.20138 type:complete len:300 (-) Transcript_6327:287-1186(-)